MTGKLVAEFQFLRAQAAEPLGQFLDYITYVVALERLAATEGG